MVWKRVLFWSVLLGGGLALLLRVGVALTN